MTESTTVIIGASIGGVRTAQALRREGYTGGITLVSDETILPYDKPPLSKGLLAGTDTIEDIQLLSDSDIASLDIDLLRGRRAVDVELDVNRVTLETGQTIAYEHLVIATGARARPSPWGQQDGIHVVRTLDDAQRLRDDLHRGGRLAIIGAGFIGSEVAASARRMGLSVTLVGSTFHPMARALGCGMGSRFTALHQRNGVETIFGAEVGRITGQRGKFTLHLDDDRTVGADYVVVAIGAIPNDEWLSASGLQLCDGVVCDAYCRAAGTTNVYAVGDIARWPNPSRRCHTRVEHWTNATEQAAVVAHNIVDPQNLMTHSPIEYIWTDQYDWKIRIAGRTAGDDLRLEVIGDDSPAGGFAGLYTADGDCLSGVVVVNWPRAVVAGRKALSAGTPYAQLKQTLEQNRAK